MSMDHVLQRLRDSCAPAPGAKMRIQSSLQAKIADPAWLKTTRDALAPLPDARQRIWSRVARTIDSPAASLLERMRDALAPDLGAVRLPVSAALTPSPVSAYAPWMRWVTGFAVFALLVSAVPPVFLATPTVAESVIAILPTAGTVYVDRSSTLEPLSSDTTMTAAVRLRTASDGAVAVAAYDDYVLRLDRDTDVEWHDLTDRPEPTIDGPTVTLWSGRAWLAGLLPSNIRAVSVATPAGDIRVQEGSIDIDVDGSTVRVRVFDRRAVIIHEGRELLLVAGEATQLWRGSLPRVQEISPKDYTEPWVAQNLSYDAVHRQEIAQWQQERRAAQAGILPTSSLYSAKRALERVSELTAFDEEARVQRKLDQADARLNEAAALLQEGEMIAAAVTLEEYRDTIRTVAAGSGDSVAHFLLRQKLAENAADLSASAPDDQGYVLKRTALEAGATLGSGTESDNGDVVLADALQALNSAVLTGDHARADALYRAMRPSLVALDSREVAPVIRKEASAVLRRFATSFAPAGGTGAELASELQQYLPPDTSTPVPLSAQQIAAIVGGILDRTTGVYRTERALSNSFTAELEQLRGHAEEPRILEQLRLNLTHHPSLDIYVRARLRELRRDRMQGERAVL